MTITNESTNQQSKQQAFWQMLFFREEPEVTAALDEQVWFRTRLYMYTAAILVGVWGAFDFFIDYENLWFFLLLRAIYTPFILAIAFYFSKSIFRKNHKTWALIHYFLLIIDIGIMVLWTDNFVKYLIGFSTIFWGAAVIMMWRFWYTVIPALIAVLVAVLRYQFFPHNVPLEEFVTGIYYFSTCLIFTTVISAYSYRTTYLLAKQNITLEKTLSQLILAEKQSSLNMLVAGVAHELNTPVGTVLTAITYARDEIKQLLAALTVGEISIDQLENPANNSLDSLDSAIHEIDRAIALIDTFKRTAADQSTYEKFQFDLVDYIKKNIVEISLKPRLRSKHIQVKVNADSKIILDSYPGEFAQIFTNLITNSIIHGYPDSDVTEQQKLITINLAKSGADTITIHYSDNGKGMSEQVLNRIFDPFFTTRGIGIDGGRQHQGTGLGMSIVYNIITKKLGGTIKAVNKPSGGAEFVITLPQG